MRLAVGCEGNALREVWDGIRRINMTFEHRRLKGIPLA